jgi:arginase
VRLSLIEVPYHLGVQDVGTGRAPRLFLDAGLEQVLADAGHDVALTRVARDDGRLDELSAVVETNVALAAVIRDTIAAGRLPLILSGDCNASLGVTAGLGAQSTAVVWLDAHGDFNTPETSPSGYLDGMPLALTTGLCFRDQVWDRLGSDCVPEAHVVHGGGRDFDDGERRNLSASRLAVIPAAELVRQGAREALWPVLQKLRRGRRLDRRPGEPGPLTEVYLHVDIDVLGEDYAPAVGFPAPGGLRPAELADVIAFVGASLRIRAVTLSGMDPQRPDPGGRTVSAGIAALQAAVAAAGG